MRTPLSNQYEIVHALGFALRIAPDLQSALKLIEGTVSKPAQKVVQKILGKISEDAEVAFSGFERLVQILFIQGYKTGNLNLAMKQAGLRLQLIIKYRKDALKQCLYPAVVGCMVMGFLFLVSYVIVPKLKPVFNSSRIVLPTTTKLLFFGVEFLRNNVLTIVGAGVVCIGVLIFVLRKNNTVLRLMWYLRIARKLVVSSISLDVLAVMYWQAVIKKPLGIGLQMLIPFLPLRTYKESVTKLIESSKQGDWSELSTHIWHPMISRYLALGLQTGNVKETLEAASQCIEDERTSVLSNYQKLIEPLCLLLMSGILAFVMSAIMLPLYQLSRIAP